MAADFYKELGVERTASSDEIKKAYRKLAAELHPDKNPGNAAVESRFKSVNRANQVLSDKKKRALYDEFGEEGLREGFQPAHARAYRRATSGGGGGVGNGAVAFEDLFNTASRGGLGDLMGDLFGARGGARRKAPPSRGTDLSSDVTVDFADAIRGTTVHVQQRDGTEPVKVRIPPGAGDGDRVRVAGHGAPGRNGSEPGDLLITVRVRPHAYFEREGLDLKLDLPITVAEAYRGAKVTIPTPEGPVGLKLPVHAQSGQVVRLKGRGVRRKDQVGDLLVRFMIRLPDSDSDEMDRSLDVLSKPIADQVRADLRL
ncbi:MAG TPA: DnaJ C-terminal domain-containing protein [Polyangiaceae bacterium]|jgi:curved DNA-binding protein|nr:DnaJ C-terminal domain-containing protein [Polyangiaceae bacterium]